MYLVDVMISETVQGLKASVSQWESPDSFHLSALFAPFTLGKRCLVSKKCFELPVPVIAKCLKRETGNEDGGITNKREARINA